MEFSETFKNLEEKLTIQFNDKNILCQAFTHRSYLNENPTYTLGHNERLEFLGDAVLELTVSRYLYDNYPDDPEGYLTSYRSAVVRTEMLACKAKELNLGSYLLLSKGEKNSGGDQSAYILANTFEALVGAIYLDQGLEKVTSFLSEFLFTEIHEIIEAGKYKDSKSTLQEVAQKKMRATPTYKVVQSTGPDHDKTFVVRVSINGKPYGIGKGKSKQEAQQDAATKGIELLNSSET